MRRILENDDQKSKDGTKRVVKMLTRLSRAIKIFKIFKIIKIIKIIKVFKILTRLSSASSCLLRDLVGEGLGEREADLGSCVILIRTITFLV